MAHASKNRSEKVDDPSIPVTLLTGFLGAGKTTLLNQLLAVSTSEPTAVIVNEFGEVGLDHDLIEKVDGDVMLMSSGCLCCSIRGDLSDTFVKLLARRDEGMHNFGRIVIETTGLADPGPILQTLLVDPFLARNTRMDGVVTVVDAVNGPATLDAQFEAVSQVAVADLIVLTKTDLVSEASDKAVTERLRGLNPTADIVRPSDRDFGPKSLRNLTSMRENARQQDAISWTTPKVANDPLGNLSGLMSTSNTKPVTTSEFRRHDTDISSVSIVLDEALHDAVFDKWFDTLIAYKGRDILRVKGILFLEGIESPFAFHGVQHVFDPPVPLKNWTGKDRRTRIVLIGRNLNRPEIQRSLDMLRNARPADAKSLTKCR
ncbi:GTP-binding protein [Ruegeria sp. HKCCA6837]|uniref:CobW family GTP-binding protein n=1 Tax=Ruegeria sp. HKCCA6837 TaxID=2682989 RepID=UPI0014896B8E|nr:GTP-binding protein [Ruegeria sp. HKCCA6837]